MSDWQEGIEYEQNLSYLPSVVWEPMSMLVRYEVVEEDNSKSVWCAQSIAVKAEQSRTSINRDTRGTSINRVARGVNIVRG